MTTATFDTLNAARALEAAGIERRHAEAHAEVLHQAVTADRDALATKADLEALETRLRADLASKADMAAVRSELATIRWSIGLLAAFVFAVGLRVFGIL